MKHLKKYNEILSSNDDDFGRGQEENNSGEDEILKFAAEINFSAHDVLDDLIDKDIIKTFYSEDAPKDSSGMVITMGDAELLAYEYVKRYLAKDK